MSAKPVWASKFCTPRICCSIRAGRVGIFGIRSVGWPMCAARLGISYTLGIAARWSFNPHSTRGGAVAPSRSLTGAIGGDAAESSRTCRRGAQVVVRPLETFFEEAFRRRADRSTVVSSALWRRAQRLGVRPELMRWLPQGCVVSRPRSGDRVAARRQLGLNAEQPVVMSVGALTRSELQLLLASLRLLAARWTDCQMVLVGKHTAAVPREIRALPQVTCRDHVADDVLVSCIQASDTLITPLADTIASWARWPSKVNAFLAAGSTTVITAIGDLAALLDRDRAGVVVPCQADDVVAGLIRLFSEPELRATLERNALRVAHELLAWPILAQQLEDLYRELVDPTITYRDPIRGTYGAATSGGSGDAQSDHGWRASADREAVPVDLAGGGRTQPVLTDPRRGERIAAWPAAPRPRSHIPLAAPSPARAQMAGGRDSPGTRSSRPLVPVARRRDRGAVQSAVRLGPACHL